jgi:hypothetical protein
MRKGKSRQKGEKRRRGTENKRVEINVDMGRGKVGGSKKGDDHKPELTKNLISSFHGI